MALARLRRQDFHTCLCAIILILIHGFIYYKFSPQDRLILPLAILDILGIIISGAANIPLLNRLELLFRYTVVSLAILLVMMVRPKEFQRAVLIFFLTNIAYIFWMLLAKLWIHHQIAPAWTMLVYDTSDNLERAQMIARLKPNLIQDSYHLEYKGDIVDIDHFIDILRIGQIIISLESDSNDKIEEIIAYCRQNGIVAITYEPNKGLEYIRPKQSWGKK
jgi:hypothetical protein